MTNKYLAVISIFVGIFIMLSSLYFMDYSKSKNIEEAKVIQKYDRTFTSPESLLIEKDGEKLKVEIRSVDFKAIEVGTTISGELNSNGYLVDITYPNFKNKKD